MILEEAQDVDQGRPFRHLRGVLHAGSHGVLYSDPLVDLPRIHAFLEAFLHNPAPEADLPSVGFEPLHGIPRTAEMPVADYFRFEGDEGIEAFDRLEGVERGRSRGHDNTSLEGEEAPCVPKMTTPSSGTW